MVPLYFFFKVLYYFLPPIVAVIVFFLPPGHLASRFDQVTPNCIIAFVLARHIISVFVQESGIWNRNLDFLNST